MASIDDGDNPYQFYVQKYDGDLPKIGSILSERIHAWAWGQGKNDFPPDLFKTGMRSDVFMKYVFSENLKKITPSPGDLDSCSLKSEISKLKSIRPHAVITTNFDTFLEGIFDDYEVVVGQKVIKYNMNSFGEIFKIHGCVSDSPSMILTSEDFNGFEKKQRYIYSKLLTYLAEHPVFILGYSLQDPNVKSLISDVGQIISRDDGIIDNIYYVKWDPDADRKAKHTDTHAISADGIQYSVRCIVASDFDWIFEALSGPGVLTSINTKLVRALAARTYKLIRTDIPKGIVEVDYQRLERVAENSDELPSLLGITKSENPNATHPFTISQIAAKLGYNYWKPVDNLFKKIQLEKDIDIKSSDNRFHISIKTGSKKGSVARKYSADVIDLLKKVKRGKEYDVAL